MPNYKFGSKELCKCLTKLGFSENKQKGTSHVKFSLNSLTTPGVRPFIIVIMGRKKYDPHTANSYFHQITKLGFSKNDIESNL